MLDPGYYFRIRMLELYMTRRAVNGSYPPSESLVIYTRGTRESENTSVTGVRRKVSP